MLDDFCFDDDDDVDVDDGIICLPSCDWYATNEEDLYIGIDVVVVVVGSNRMNPDTGTTPLPL